MDRLRISRRRMLIPFEDFAVVLARVIALHALDLVSGTQLGAAFRQIREKDLARLALGALEQDVPFTGNKCAHFLIHLGTGSSILYTRQDLSNTFPRARLLELKQLASLTVAQLAGGRATDRRYMWQATLARSRR